MNQEAIIDDTQTNAEKLARQGQAFFLSGQPAKALQCYMNALFMEPENKQYMQAFIRCLPQVKYKIFNPAEKKAFMLCFKETDVAHRHMSKAWLELVQLDPVMMPLVALSEYKNYEDFKQNLNTQKIRPALMDLFFLIGLKKCKLLDIKFEKLMTFLRRFYLMEATLQQRQEALPFLCCVATKCFNNDYIFDVIEAERVLADQLKIKENIFIEELVLLACYFPLYQYFNTEHAIALADQSGKPGVIAVVKQQIKEPEEEKKIAQNIQSFTALDNDISLHVKAQYEDHPYPRWTTCEKYHLGPLQRELSQGKDILIAGCGTGQEATLVHYEMPLARIDAIDLSYASLSYAIRKAQERHIENIRFMQGDILHLQKLDKKYDFIFSSGVLHHMEDPAAGLKVLRDILKPKGAISIALYSELGRTDVVAGQQWVKQQGYPSTTEGIRQFRQDIINMADDNPLKKVMYVADFYSTSECRDLLFHVQEHRFTCPKIRELIDSLDLLLLRFGSQEIGSKKAYLKMFPDDDKAVNLDNWQKLEEENPYTFKRMYSMILGKKEEYNEGHKPEWIDALGIFNN